MSLSLVIMTKDSSAYIDDLLRVGRVFADEIVVGVDSSSSDSTEEVCRLYADKLFRMEPIGYTDRAEAWLRDQCNGDWILRLDDDELPSVGLVKALMRLMDDRDITHYWLRRRWVVGRQRARWIVEHPWWPDLQLRLYRNIRSIVRVAARPHASNIVQGGARFVTEGSIYHFDLVYHDNAQRRQKVEQYERVSPIDGLQRYYLASDEASLSTLPIPNDDRPLAPRSASWAQPLAMLARRWTRAMRLPIREVSLTELDRSSMQACDYGPELFRGMIECIDCPRTMIKCEHSLAHIQLRNDSDLAWPLAGLGIPEVRLSYHWLDSTGAIYERDGIRTPLPHTVRPGETAILWAPVRAPDAAGTFVLEWDLVIENVAWFSDRGWTGPTVEVQIE